MPPLIAQGLLHESAAVESVRIYGWVMIALVFEDSASALLRLNERYRVLALQRIAGVAVRGVALLLLWQIGLTLDLALWAMVGWFLVDKLMLVPLAIWAYRSMGYSLAPLRDVLSDRSLIRSLLPFTVLTSAYAIMEELRGRLDLIVLGGMVSPEQLGGYDVARRTVRQGELLVQPLQESLQPRLAMLYA